MIFDIITIFPGVFREYIDTGLLGKARSKGLLEINIHDLRNWTEDRHRKVDDRPFGGGLGMVMKVEPIIKAVAELKKDNSKVILFGPGGKKFDQSSAHRFYRNGHLIMICGRYEGVDERVSQYIADEEISIGEYVLMGGEVPAMAVTETVSRLIPGVVGKDNFLKERTGNSEEALEYPQFTRPAIFKPGDFLSSEKYEKLILKGEKISDTPNQEWKVPDILVSGDHNEISEWRKTQSRKIQ